MNVQKLEKHLLQNSCRQRQTRIVGWCLTPQVAVLDFSLDLPFSISYRLMLSPPDFATFYLLILRQGGSL